MVPNPHTYGTPSGGADTIVGSLDSAGPSDEYVIADISADGAWLSMRADDAMTLTDWR
ncbi:hypothetical protein ACFQGT_13385 [Natrialbaceae archaeon GCM10025810]|uniref:DUF7556 family protein n=1 Tax=Halovalidus salilacus TaxID=3075124 RepID=UPI003621CEB5